MAKEITKKIKLQIPAGKATPAPPVGTVLGPAGINLQEFCTKFNDATRDKMGDILPVEISIYEDRTFDMVLKTPPVAFLLKKVAKIQKGASKGEVVASITKDQLKEIAEISNYLDVVLLDLPNESWCKVSYDGQEGYVLASALTSQSATPGIVSQNKVQRIVSRLNFNMQLNVKSGLSLADFKRVLSGESKDKNKVIEQNAEAFYNAEQKYNVNGILLAAMAVHESGWGTSAISLQKKNLFGYGAYDRDPYNSAYSYDTYAEGIDFVAKMLAKTYLNPAGVTLGDGDVSTGRYYTSPTLIGINTKYSTDPNWCTKVFSYMTYFYDKL